MAIPAQRGPAVDIAQRSFANPNTEEFAVGHLCFSLARLSGPTGCRRKVFCACTVTSLPPASRPTLPRASCRHGSAPTCRACCTSWACSRYATRSEWPRQILRRPCLMLGGAWSSPHETLYVLLRCVSAVEGTPRSGSCSRMSNDMSSFVSPYGGPLARYWRLVQTAVWKDYDVANPADLPHPSSVFSCPPSASFTFLFFYGFPCTRRPC